MKANNNFNKKIYEVVLANQKKNETPDETEQKPPKDENSTENPSGGGEEPNENEPKTPEEDSPLKEE